MLLISPVFAEQQWFEKPQTVLKLANANPLTVNTAKSKMFFCERVNELTHGRIKVEYYHSGALGRNERVLAEQLQVGTLDLSHLASASYSTIVPELGILSLGYFVRNYGHWYRIMASPIGDFLKEKSEEKGIKILGYYVCAMRNVFLADHPVHTPEDFKGVKIRVMEDKMSIETFKALGAIPTPLPYGEVYTALQTGVVDAAENHITAYLGMKFNEPAPYYSLTEHMGCPCLLAMSLKTWDALDKEAQDAVLQAAKEELGWIRGYNVYDIPRAMKYAQEEEGVKINTIDKQKFVDVVKPLHDKYIPQLIGEDLYKVYKSIPVTPEVAWDEKTYLYETE
jgi:tripartite ATP-independent transporter DctP family solute receptor